MGRASHVNTFPGYRGRWVTRESQWKFDHTSWVWFCDVRHVTGDNWWNYTSQKTTTPIASVSNLQTLQTDSSFVIYSERFLSLPQLTSHHDLANVCHSGVLEGGGADVIANIVRTHLLHYQDSSSFRPLITGRCGHARVWNCPQRPSIGTGPPDGSSRGGATGQPQAAAPSNHVAPRAVGSDGDLQTVHVYRNQTTGE